MTNGIVEWLSENGAYEYYFGKLQRLLADMEYTFTRKNASVFYKNFQILNLEIYGRQLYLIEVDKKNYTSKQSIIQNKLYHEYYVFFKLRRCAFKVLQVNIVLLEEYIYRVRTKIDVGFERYIQLINKEMLTIENSGYLKIEIDNAFSLLELNELLESYNRLYSLIDILLENGYDNVSEENVKYLENNHSLILESISIGSKGDLFTVGKETVLMLIKSLLSIAFENDRQVYELKKVELEHEMAQSQLFIQHRQEVEYLISTLDKYMQIKENGTNLSTLPYIQNEITIIIARIEKLQGSNHINLMV